MKNFVLLLITSLFASCTQMGPNVIKTKVMSLNPAEYIDKQVFLRGVVSHPQGAFSLFNLVDDTGFVLVTTEKLPVKISCPIGNEMLAVGIPKRVNSSDVILVLSEVRECKYVSKREARTQ